MDSCEFCKESIALIDNEVRKTLKEMEISSIDAIILLVQAFNLMNHEVKKQIGSKGLKKFYLNCQEHENNILSFAFQMALPLNEVVKNEFKKDEKNERVRNTPSPSGVSKKRDCERDPES